MSKYVGGLFLESPDTHMSRSEAMQAMRKPEEDPQPPAPLPYCVEPPSVIPPEVGDGPPLACRVRLENNSTGISADDGSEHSPRSARSRARDVRFAFEDPSAAATDTGLTRHKGKAPTRTISSLQEPQSTDMEAPKRCKSNESSQHLRGKSKESPQPKDYKKSVFTTRDAEEIKKRVRERLTVAPYDVKELYWKEGIWQKVAKADAFENLTLVVIAANAVWISVDTDWNGADSLPEASTVFQFAESLFCIYFSGEWFVRFMAFKRKINGFKDRWFAFDSGLVFMMVMETVVFTLLQLTSGSDGGSPLGNTAILRLFRLLRLSRLLRMLRSLPELMILIKGMLSAMKSVGYVMALLLMVTYVFAIALTQLSDGYAFKEVLFANVALSMYSLLVYGTFLDNLSWFCNTIRAESPLCLCMVLVFIALACLTILNMLIGVLCEIISQVAQEEKDVMMCDLVREKFGAIVKELDDDNDGTISLVEFRQILANPSAITALQFVNVDPVGLIDFAELFFVEDGVECQITFQKFMELVLDLRGTSQATVKDIMNLGKQAITKLDSLKSNLKEVGIDLRRVEDIVQDGHRHLEDQVGAILAEIQARTKGK